ncbi:Glycosyl hydrolase family 10 protein / carbohydrate-binding domain-containing protein isoform 2 [Hibiscus syriacus]|uniref:Glycosyl hydrolase family 10 protein / carbohydrate-binding domain-containing protein isoform 2 n=1 Tax=Hibiscus syriacus TaxID=106335 RepID=A0A6A2WM44_HIBSY|nr:Glycosyl hydrolase family 10 protein / carbohydrate-binding domain-containing protein isoform 2 [Hibiscus syriacus]
MGNSITIKAIPCLGKERIGQDRKTRQRWRNCQKRSKQSQIRVGAIAVEEGNVKIEKLDGALKTFLEGLRPGAMLGREQGDAQRLLEAITVARKLTELAGVKPCSDVSSRPMPRDSGNNGGDWENVQQGDSRESYSNGQGEPSTVRSQGKPSGKNGKAKSGAKKKMIEEGEVAGIGAVVSVKATKPGKRLAEPIRKPDVIASVQTIKSGARLDRTISSQVLNRGVRRGETTGVKAVEHRKGPSAITRDKTIKPKVQSEQPWAKKVLELREVKELSKALTTAESIKEFGVKKNKTSKTKPKAEGGGKLIHDEVKSKDNECCFSNGRESPLNDEPDGESREDVCSLDTSSSVKDAKPKASRRQVQEELAMSKEFAEHVRVENMASETIIREGSKQGLAEDVQPRQAIRMEGPECYDEAMQVEDSVKWESSMKDEMDSLMSTKTVTTDKLKLCSGGNYAVVKIRTEHWQGLEQDVTSRISPGCTYLVSARVGVSEPLSGSTNVTALKLENHGSSTSYLFIGKTSMTKRKWEMVEGTFSLSSISKRVIFIWKGHLLVLSCLLIQCLRVPPTDYYILFMTELQPKVSAESNPIGLSPESGGNYAIVKDRTKHWQGLEQDIASRILPGVTYSVSACVAVSGPLSGCTDVMATLKLVKQGSFFNAVCHCRTSVSKGKWEMVEDGLSNWSGRGCKVVLHDSMADGKIVTQTGKVFAYATERTQSWNGIQQEITGRLQRELAYNVTAIATDKDWVQLQGKFLLNGSQSRVVIYLECPPPGTDILVNVLSIQHAKKIPPSPPPVIEAHHIYFLRWLELPLVPMRTFKWPLLPVFASVQIGSGESGPQNVNVALSVDGQWVNGGQGPAAGLDLMVAGLQIFPVDRVARFKHLERQTDMTRKCDVVLQFSGSSSSSLFATSVKVTQTQNSFPIGSCIKRTNIDNEDFVDFFVKNLNWATFENELKWYWTEPQRVNFNYKDADDMLAFCKDHKIETRGHCIFWEVQCTVQQWIQALNKKDLMTAVQNRLTGLLTRYKGKFRHYDVNNEMLHGSFYQDRLGKDIRAYMFKTANQLDPSDTLFVNDYHVEDGCDTISYPEKYIEQILDLQQQRAPVGGLGYQGHIDNPVGPIELFMSRDNAHLVDAEGDINETGKRFLALKTEWLSLAHGRIDIQGQFEFRGFHGTYVVEIETESDKVSKTFVVDKGDTPLVVAVDL